MADEAVLVFATFRPQAGREDEVLEVLQGMVGSTRAEPGNEVYDLYRSGDGEPTFHLIERYTDQRALQAHRDSQHYEDYRATIPGLLAEPIEVVVLSAVNVASS